MPPEIPPPELVISPPENVTQEADEDTIKGLSSDLTGPAAHNRVFLLNLGVIKLGTDDKVHAASLFFALILLIVTIAFYWAGFRTKDTRWAEEAVKWCGSAFMFVLGVVLGKASDGIGRIEDKL